MVSKQNLTFFHSHKFPINNRIGITTGDPDGVGSYIFQQALKHVSPQNNIQFIVWTRKQAPIFKVPGFKTKTLLEESKISKEPFVKSQILQIRSSEYPGQWVQNCAERVLKKELSVIVTGPLSKKLLQKSHPGLLGQTQVLKKVGKAKSVFQTFLGSKFNVILLNDHQPFKKTSLAKLSPCIQLAKSARSLLPKQKKHLPLAVLGLNPHAGEGGLLGKEELDFPKNPSYVQGPLVPDAAFLKKNWKKFSFYLALYHDQGLIPFKLVHEQQSFAYSLGLPFVRFGVSHGTGKDLKKKDISSDSARLALKRAIHLIKARV